MSTSNEATSVCYKPSTDVKTQVMLDNKRKKDQMLRSVDVYGDEDKIEELGSSNMSSSLTKKKKRPMDSFVAPIDLEFIPRAPITNANKKALENIYKYIGQFFYENDLSFNAARSDSYAKMMQAIVQYNDPSTFKPPSYNDLRMNIMKKQYEETKKWVDDFKVHWETFGVTLMTDWWTDDKGRTLINFLVNCPKGTVFLKSIDGSPYIHDAELIQKMLGEVIEEIGEKNVIQVCTDNAANYKRAGGLLMENDSLKLYWMPCVAHCLNLMLGDVCKLPLVKNIVKEAQKISVFIYNHKHVLHLMRKETKGREIISLSVTRFATTFFCLQSMHEKHQQLRNMIRTSAWRNSKWPKNPVGMEIVLKIESDNFWNDMHTCLKIMAPLIDVLRMVNTEERPSMGYIFSAMELCKTKIKANIGEETHVDCDLWREMEKIIDNRWVDLFQKPLHCAAYYLNPQVYYESPKRGLEIEFDRVIKEGLLQCIEKLADNDNVEYQILIELTAYRNQTGRLGKKKTLSCAKTMAPVEWWTTFGSEIPALQKFAKRILGLTTIASPYERNWSIFSNIHTKKMNCLDNECLTMLAYIQYNMKLKKHYEERIFGKLIDPIKMKSIDACTEWIVSKDVRDDEVLGMDDMTYGELEDLDDGTNDALTTHSCGCPSSSRVQPQDDTSEEDDYDVEEEEDGIEMGSDEDI